MIKMLKFVCLLFLSLAILSGCKENKREYKKNTINVPIDFSQDDADADHLKYFGYYYSGFEEERNGEKLNYIEETKDHSNIIWINFSYEKYLEEARSLNKKAVIDVAPFFFGDKLLPKPLNEAKMAFKEFWKGLGEKGLHDTIALVYPLDEPIMNLRNSQKMEASEANEIMDNIVTTIKDVLREYNQSFGIEDEIKPVGVIYTVHSVVNSSLSKEYDWYAFDCYESLYRCRGYTVFQLLSKLQGKMPREDQKLFLIPEAWRKTNGKRPSFPNDIRHRLKLMYEIALNDPQIVAVIPFIWRSLENDGFGNRIQGARDITQIHPFLFSVGRKFFSEKHKMPISSYGDYFEPVAAITAVTNDEVIGYAIDHDRPHLSSQVKIFIDNEEQETIDANHFDRTFNTNSDIYSIGKHKFVFPIPEKFKDGQSHTVHVYALNYDSGDETCLRIGCFNTTNRYGGPLIIEINGHKVPRRSVEAKGSPVSL